MNNICLHDFEHLQKTGFPLNRYEGCNEVCLTDLDFNRGFRGLFSKLFSTHGNFDH